MKLSQLRFHDGAKVCEHEGAVYGICGPSSVDWTRDYSVTQLPGWKISPWGISHDFLAVYYYDFGSEEWRPTTIMHKSPEKPMIVGAFSTLVAAEKYLKKVEAHIEANRPTR